MARLRFCLVLILMAAPAFGQQPSAKKPNELVAGKLVYVGPMPDDLDRWVVDYLDRWGKYKVTANPEGVDLVIRADVPEKPTQYEMRDGVPQPRRGKGKSSRTPIPGT